MTFELHYTRDPVQTGGAKRQLRSITQDRSLADEWSTIARVSS